MRRLFLVLLGGLLLAHPAAALAEAKCETKTQTCMDARTGIPRICLVTICKDDLGNITTTDIIVLKEGEATTTTTNPGPKVVKPAVKLSTTKKQ